MTKERRTYYEPCYCRDETAKYDECECSCRNDDCGKNGYACICDCNCSCGWKEGIRDPGGCDWECTDDEWQRVARKTADVHMLQMLAHHLAVHVRYAAAHNRHATDKVRGIALGYDLAEKAKEATGK